MSLLPEARPKEHCSGHLSTSIEDDAWSAKDLTGFTAGEMKHDQTQSSSRPEEQIHGEMLCTSLYYIMLGPHMLTFCSHVAMNGNATIKAKSAKGARQM